MTVIIKMSVLVIMMVMAMVLMMMIVIIRIITDSIALGGHHEGDDGDTRA